MTAQYQSFPGAAGDSRTLDKLKALALPDLAGRSFLDVGCNEGFFCGFAQHLGASRVVGIDHGAAFVERARKRFPGCEFLKQGWDTLPEGQFDVILLASALHYAEDQPALIARLVDKLAPGGVLVLELGIVSSAEAQWVKVQRGIDERWFPTMPQLREDLAGYAWKWMGPSITQDGDPVKRHVLHISRRLPVAYLLLKPPGFGKSSIAKRLFPRTKVRLVSGDRLLGLVARGKRRKTPAALAELVRSEYAPFELDRTIEAIFARGLVPELVQLWRSAAGKGDVAIDMYVPGEHHATVRQALADAGYLPVVFEWDRPGPPLLPSAALAEGAESFYLSLADAADGRPPRRHEPAGFIDEVSLDDGVLEVRGWAITATGSLPASLLLRAGGRDYTVDRYEKQLRADVQAHLDLPHALFGWRARVALAGPVDAQALAGSIAVSGRDGDGLVTPFQSSGSAAGWVAPAA